MKMQKEKIKTLEMQRYYNLKENHICVVCGKREAIEDHVLCPICRAKKQENNIGQSERLKGRYDALKAKGICVSCGKEKVIEGRVRCYRCIEKSKQRRKKKYLKSVV